MITIRQLLPASEKVMTRSAPPKKKRESPEIQKLIERVDKVRKSDDDDDDVPKGKQTIRVGTLLW